MVLLQAFGYEILTLCVWSLILGVIIGVYVAGRYYAKD